ncbi:MAG: SusD/RagB family nutrient-binding outer membrane lipoprotein [Chitinophagales bacterium]|nr:SusD/RagB family nutrient-binding outer membrane lipoprotein [Chitinophagales bacterium]
MKFSKYILLIAALMIVHTSCDDGFDELNVNPTAGSEIDPNFQFTWVQLRTSGGRYENWRANLIYSSMMMQHLASTCSYWTGDKYTYNGSYSSSLFDRAYNEQVKDMQDLINTLETKEGSDPTMLGMAKIWRVVIFHRLTDLYGDVPYFQAGKGFLEAIDFPEYDAQQDIYMDMLNELEEGIGLLSSGTGFGGADLIYAGDVDKWTRFGYSLMLRLAMRLSQADESTAKSWVTKAVNGGVMESNDDIAFIQHESGPEGINRNGIGEVLDQANGFGDDCPRLSKTMVDWMLATGDPRLDIFGKTPKDGGGHNGLPNGLDETTIQDNPTGTSADSSFSYINPVIVTVASPMIFQTYAETQFLLAEAAKRGWASGSAEEYYNNGVRAGIQQWVIYDASLEVDDADVDTYLVANPFDDSFEQIGWQYWAATFLNEYETFANWRRTGYPTLTPVNYPGNVTGGQIPSRMVYAESEIGLNPNLDAALSRQGMTTDFSTQMTVPVWWDK